MKLYFRKLGKGLLYLLFIWLLSALLDGVLATFLNIVAKDNPMLWSLLYLSVPVIGASIFTYKKRLTHADERREYLHRLEKDKFRFFPQLLWVLQSRDYLAELAAFFTVFVPVFIGMIVSSTNFSASLLAAVFYIVVFAVIDLLLWLFVHRAWASERVSVEK